MSREVDPAEPDPGLRRDREDRSFYDFDLDHHNPLYLPNTRNGNGPVPGHSPSVWSGGEEIR